MRSSFTINMTIHCLFSPWWLLLPMPLKMVTVTYRIALFERPQAGNGTYIDQLRIIILGALSSICDNLISGTMHSLANTEAQKKMGRAISFEKMTFSQLLEMANGWATGTVKMSRNDSRLLTQLLIACADEVLEDGQTIIFDGVRLNKMPMGIVLVLPPTEELKA